MFRRARLSIPQPVLAEWPSSCSGLSQPPVSAFCRPRTKVDFTDNKNFITMAVALTHSTDWHHQGFSMGRHRHRVHRGDPCLPDT